VCHKAVLYKVNNKLFLHNKNKGNGMVSEVKLLCTKTCEVQDILGEKTDIHYFRQIKK